MILLRSYRTATSSLLRPSLKSIPIARTTATPRTLTMTSTTPNKPIKFGNFEVTDQVFLTTPFTFALVNLMPLLPGHVLVCPHAPHKRLTDLSPEELTDLFVTVQRVQRMLARHYFSPSPPSSSAPPSSSSSSTSAPTQSSSNPQGGLTHPKPEDGSFNIAVQDGQDAGQTVPHVHVHVIPRIHGWTAKPGTPGAGGGDELYERMAGEDGNVGGQLWDRDFGQRPRPGGGFPPIEDKDRKARSKEEMRAEAEGYRRLLDEMSREEGDGGDGRKKKKGDDVGSPDWWGRVWPKGGPEDAGPGY